MRTGTVPVLVPYSALPIFWGKKKLEQQTRLKYVMYRYRTVPCVTKNIVLKNISSVRYGTVLAYFLIEIHHCNLLIPSRPFLPVFYMNEQKIDKIMAR